MDHFMQNLSSHPATVFLALFVGVLIVYFLFKQLLKVALVFILILLAIGGYLYLKDPQKMPRNMTETLKKAGTAVDQGKQVYAKGKAMAQKGKKLTEDMDNLLVGRKNATTDKEKPLPVKGD